MSSRLVRDEMLESERVHGVPVEARWLFLTIMLCADDVGLFEVSEFKLARKAGIEQKVCSTLLPVVADADLIRLYQVDGRTYGFVPRFRQRLQIKRTRHPLPPAALMADDDDAVNKINGLASNPRLGSSEAPRSTAVQPPEPEPEPVSTRLKTPPPPKGGAKRFAEFWTRWPSNDRKVAKPQCERKWRTKRCDAIADVVLSALTAQAKSPKWAEEGGKFIPAPLTWLNQERWEAPIAGTGQHWAETREGIEWRGVELGIGAWNRDAWERGQGGDDWLTYRRKVFEAARALAPA